VKVAHLIILTTKIAQTHPGNPTLLSDIKATYKWLDRHAEAAREHLLLVADEKLFLNVDDANLEWWEGQWVSASEVVLNLHYDFDGIKRVHNFLQPYDKLLRAAGCGVMSIFDRHPRPAEDADSTPSHTSEFLKNFNEMRKLGEMTDLVFVPVGVDDDADEAEASPVEDDDEVHPDLCGHRALVAAAIPHFRTRMKGWKDSQTRRVKFDGTAFGAKALLGRSHLLLAYTSLNLT